ncbi:DNA repair protein RecO [Candidatus Omnitrophota bacterium]
MSINKTEALVLKKYEVRETSLIANFYTRDFGKVSGILKGIRKNPEKFASSLEPFSLNELIFYKKENNPVHLVSACDLKDNFNLIRQNMQRITCASIIAELLDVLMPAEDRNEEIFDLAIESLKALEINTRPEKIAAIFKIKLLALSGFKPHIDSCVSCDSRIAGESRFSLNLGGLLCQRCFPRDTKSRQVFRGTVASILHIERNEFKDNLNLGMNPQIKKELDMVLNSFLNFHLGKELKSVKVSNKLALTV